MVFQSDELKRQKNEFVSGHSGSSVYDIVLTLLVCVLNYASWKLHHRAFQPSDSLSSILLDAIILLFPFLAALLFFEYVGHLLLAQILVSLIFLFFPATSSIKDAKSKSNERLSASLMKPSERNHIPFIVTFRGFLQWVTILCILAVDFPQFPRKFAKVETFGTSIMDLGVGAAIFASGIVAGPRMHKESLGGLWKSIKLAAPLIVLGIGRLVATKSVNYQEHVTEYGVHWNFFFTLGSIPILLSLTHIFLPFFASSPIILGWVLGISYQVFLTFYGGEKFILTAPRIDFVSMNREGLCSLVGYLAIFLFAAEAGRVLSGVSVSRGKKKDSSDTGEWKKQVWALGVRAVITGVIYLFLNEYLGVHVSRRMANLTYVLWVSWMSYAFLLSFRLAELVEPSSQSSIAPLLFRAINYNLLFLFLLANIGTGLVNLSINTLSATMTTCLVVLSAYITTIVVLAYILYKHGIRIKI